MSRDPKRKKPVPKPRPTERGAGGTPPLLTANIFKLICEKLAESGSKYKACDALGFEYSTVHQAIRDQAGRGDDSWQEAWDYAYDQFKDSLEQAAIARARDGTPTEFRIGRNGEAIPTKIEFSDRLAEVLLKGHFPERYRDRVYHSGTVGLEPVDAFANLSAKAKRKIRAIIMEDLEEQREAARAQEPIPVAVEPGAMLEDMRGADDAGVG